MLKIIVLISSITVPAMAMGEPFSQGDASIGKTMVEENCISCHAGKYGGDGSAIYTREDRKIKTSSGLLTQIRNCNTMLGLKWFEDDELHVARYLNNAYYKFEK